MSRPRSRVGLREVASLETLAWACWRAARGKRHRREVDVFTADLEGSLARLGAAVGEGRAPVGRWTRFEVFDPKPRQILAPCFEDRVLHHAMMRHMAPVLDRALVDDTFACRPGRGLHAAVRRAQHHLRRHPWFVQADVRAFFASIPHEVVLEVLRRRFSNPELLALCARVLVGAPVPEGRGLPIGALTSQHVANHVLDGLDRFLLERLGVRGMVRYMDDVVWWVDDREQARESLALARSWLLEARGLELKPTARIGRSEHGLLFLGFRIQRGRLRLSRRRRVRFAASRRRWEARWSSGEIDGVELQRGVDAAMAITAHADAAAWRRAELRRRPPVDA